jgi:hypothetical protein
MRHVDFAAFPPGQAIGNGPSSDLIDTGFDGDSFNRLYLSRQQVMDAWAALGYPSLQAYNALEEDRDRLQGQVDRLTESVRELSASVEEAESLRDAIAFTLERGAVANSNNKGRTVYLRHLPGQARIDLKKSLYAAKAD